MSTYTRTNPYISYIKERTLLSAPSSTKKTYHLSLELSQNHLPFTVGDSVAVYPANHTKTVETLLERLKLSGSEEIFDARAATNRPLRDFLLYKANLCKANSTLLKALHLQGEAVPLENKGEVNQLLQSHSVLDILKKYPNARLCAQEFSALLMPLMPRFYSIASSPSVHPDEIHLLIASLTYETQGEIRQGVASGFLCSDAEIESTPIPIYIQPSNGFQLPPLEAPMIMIGPGTGVAPFRAFLQERLTHNAGGANWLFFGERSRHTDFYYEPFFTELQKQQFLRLDTAFSRDQAEKIYVQHRLYENSAAVWDWLQQGAYLFVCGDAERMAKDVDKMLQLIVQEQGGLTEEAARFYLKALRTEKRYRLDVY